jgi:hypothetical protein
MEIQERVKMSEGLWHSDSYTATALCPCPLYSDPCGLTVREQDQYLKVSGTITTAAAVDVEAVVRIRRWEAKSFPKRLVYEMSV